MKHAASLAVGLLLSLAGCGGTETEFTDPGADPALETAESAVTTCDFKKLEPACQVRECFCPNGITGLPLAWQPGGREDATPEPFARVASRAHWVGYIIQGAAVCPGTPPGARGHWEVSQPFADATAVPELRRFCEYTWMSDVRDQSVPEIELLPNLRGGDPAQPAGGTIMRLEPDLEAGVALGEPVPAEAWQPLRDAWMRQVDFTGGLDHGTLADRTDADVRVAIIDASQEGLGDVYDRPWGSLSRHANTVGSIIDLMVCPLGDTGIAGCSAQIRNYLALNNTAADTQAGLLVREPGFSVQGANTGGYFGRIHDVARAVNRAVSEWRRDKTCAGDPALCNPDLKLVLNMSLGWTQEFTGPSLSAMRAPVRAAYLAVREARCSGALVLAAAGNREPKRSTATGVKEITGPMFPAGWEKLAIGACTPVAAGTYAPLVHSVGGVTGRSELLGNARPSSIPRLLAAGENVALSDRVDSLSGLGQGTVPATGSSLATAAVAAIAADVWALRPELGPDAVMNVVYQSALPTTRDAQVYRSLQANGTKYKQRVASHCLAIQNACREVAPTPAACPSAEVLNRMALSCRSTLDADLSADMNVVLEAAYPGILNQTLDPDTVPRLTAANAQAMETAGGLSELSFPAVVPQPGYTNCPLCTVGAAAAVTLKRPFTGKVDLAPGISMFASAKLSFSLGTRTNSPTTCPAEVNFALTTVAGLRTGATFSTTVALATLNNANATEAKCIIKSATLTLVTPAGEPYQTKENITVK
jgi:subtilisin family serine protease